MFTVRAARREDGPVLQEIEGLAGARFREAGLATIASHDPASLDELAEYAHSGRSWVAVDESDKAVGYVIVDDADRNAHVEQMSVVPEHQHRGCWTLAPCSCRRLGFEHRSAGHHADDVHRGALEPGAVRTPRLSSSR